MSDDKRLLVFAFVFACSAVLNGLGHQIQIQRLKSEVAQMRLDLDSAQAAQVRSEEALSQALLTLVDFGDQDDHRRKVDAALEEYRREIGIPPARRARPGDPPAVQYLRAQGFR